MKMFCFGNVRRKKRAYLLGGKLAVDIRKHIDAALALRVDGDPHESGLFALDGFNAGKIQAVVGESLGDQPAAVIVADQAQPGG